MSDQACCKDMAKALANGTDSEGCSPAITYDTDNCEWESEVFPPPDLPDGYYLGVKLPLLKFCPWCGGLLELQRHEDAYDLTRAAADMLDALKDWPMNGHPSCHPAYHHLGVALGRWKENYAPATGGSGHE